MEMMRLGTAAALVLASLAAPVGAETSAVSPAGFSVNFREEVVASSDETWKAIVQLPRWWSGMHTYSGQASNLSLDLGAGGCWCERWGDGQAVMHGQVVLVQPGRVIRMRANLGPLLEIPVQGVFTIATGASEGKTFLRMSYRVAGNSDAGLDKLAAAVDQVLAEQFKRLKRLAETGKPE